MNKKDKETLLKSVPNEGHRQILMNLEYLDEQKGNKFRRRREEMTSEGFKEYEKRLESSEYDILRTEPPIVEVIRGIHMDKLDNKRFPYVEKKKYVPPKIAQPQEKKRKGKDEETESADESLTESPRIFIFMIGGLSHHEIVSIANLQESLNAQIIPGSNEILDPLLFL
jgi:hypothetical protein